MVDAAVAVGHVTCVIRAWENDSLGTEGGLNGARVGLRVVRDDGKVLVLGITRWIQSLEEAQNETQWKAHTSKYRKWEKEKKNGA